MYQKSEMVFKDYKWQAKADHDNPKIIGGNDHSELNRTEGYEMLYFIRSICKTFWKDGCNTITAQRIEIAIRKTVPGPPRTHGAIKDWLLSHFDNWKSINVSSYK